jgi:hypothetical protein
MANSSFISRFYLAKKKKKIGEKIYPGLFRRTNAKEDKVF